MKVAWRKVGLTVRKVVEAIFLLEEAGVISIIPDDKQDKIKTGTNIITGVIASAVPPRK